MDIVSGVLFLLLKMFLEVSASYSVSVLYGGVCYHPVEHHALLGQSFMNISGISAVMCSVWCLSHHGCLSFNYDHINRVCQMNNATGEQICDNFEGMQSVSYYEATALPMTCHQNPIGDEKDTPLEACRGFEKLGLEDGSIPDESLSASGNWKGELTSSSTAGCRLNRVPPSEDIIGAWHPSVADTNQWIQVDFGTPTYVTGFLTQGRYNNPKQWVSKYKVQFEPPLQACLVAVKDQHGLTQIFDGNTGGNDTVETRFFQPVLAGKIRIVPVEWGSFIALRFEMLGCK